MTTLLALSEYNRLAVVKTRDSLSDFAAFTFGVIIPYSVFRWGLSAAPAAVIAAAFIFFSIGIVRSGDLKDAFLSTAVKTLGMVYLALPLSYLVLLKVMDRGGMWILFLLAVIWGNDIFAYITGKGIGRHKLSPSISPGKTVEGAIGGVIGGAVAAFLFNRYAGMGLELNTALLISVVMGLVGILGDLAESVLKRAAGVKDSGTIIPGHGGILDRIDSLLFPIPVLYYCLLWLYRA